MQTNQILVTMLIELGKLILRSENKVGCLAISGLTFLNWHLGAFANSNDLVQEMQTEDKVTILLDILLKQRSDEEPCYLLLQSNLKPQKNNFGFMLHLFKGEQEIGPETKYNIENDPKHYERLLHEFRRNIRILDSIIDINTWMYLLQRYTYWIPASRHLSHISLYHYCHWKMALAACLTHQEIFSLIQYIHNKEHGSDGRLLLYKVKILGRSKFLSYKLLHQDIVALQGATWYWQLLIIELRDEFLKSLDLPLCNCLWEDCEGFTLLARPDHLEILTETQIYLEKFLASFYHGLIQMASSSVIVHLESLFNQEFPNILRILTEQLEQKEKQCFTKLFSIDAVAYSYLFGKYSNQQKDNFYASLKKVGEQLLNLRFLAIESLETLCPPTTNQSWEDLPTFFHHKIIFIDHKLEPNHSYQKIYRFNHSDFAIPNGKGFIFSQYIPFSFSSLSPEVNNYIVLQVIPYANSTAIHNRSILQYLAQQDKMASFFHTNLTSLLHKKLYRNATLYAALQGQNLILICVPQIALSLLSEIVHKLFQYTSGNFDITGKLQIFSTQYPDIMMCATSIYPNSLLRGKLILAEEIVTWSFLQSLIRAKKKLSVFNHSKNRNVLFELWKIVLQSNHQSWKADHWKDFINYHLQRLNIYNILEQHILESEKGRFYLSQALLWNYLAPDLPK